MKALAAKWVKAGWKPCDGFAVEAYTRSIGGEEQVVSQTPSRTHWRLVIESFDPTRIFSSAMTVVDGRHSERIGDSLHSTMVEAFEAAEDK